MFEKYQTRLDFLSFFDDQPKLEITNKKLLSFQKSHSAATGGVL